MATTAVLQVRLKELSASLNQIQPLVERLQNFTASIGQGDEARVELGSEIHNRLKDAEEDLELLRVEVEALDTGDSRRRTSTVGGEKEAERERVVSMAGRLTEELKRSVHFGSLSRETAGLNSLTGLVEIFEMRNCKPSAMPRLRNAKSVSYCFPDRSRLLSASKPRRRNSRKMTWR